ncbi:hypothetical protein BC629DRAFT_1558025 [Irpex lacteus]|nr:hypothetical protein BC629DRAFT_1558025 [Irpex lacteus]
MHKSAGATCQEQTLRLASLRLYAAAPVDPLSRLPPCFPPRWPSLGCRVSPPSACCLLFDLSSTSSFVTPRCHSVPLYLLFFACSRLFLCIPASPRFCSSPLSNRCLFFHLSLCSLTLFCAAVTAYAFPATIVCCVVRRRVTALFACIAFPPPAFFSLSRFTRRYVAGFCRAFLFLSAPLPLFVLPFPHHGCHFYYLPRSHLPHSCHFFDTLRYSLCASHTTCPSLGSTDARFSCVTCSSVAWRRASACI